MSTSAPRHDRVICNTTPVRIFAIVGQFQLLVDALGGTVRVPRTVLDPDDDPAGPAGFLSEIGRAERFFRTRSHDEDAVESADRLAALRSRQDIEIVDLTDDELWLFAEITSRATQREHGLPTKLGPGEGAVMALVENRGGSAVVDDAAARRALSERAPDVSVLTSREILTGPGLRLVTSAEAQLIYADMLAKRYRGPESLF